MSDPKEPHYFDDDMPRGLTNIRQYEALFRDADERHAIVAEASTGYLYSETAVSNILEYSPTARFLVSLRSPLDMALSLHNQAVKGGYETETDFSRAWRLQDLRRRGLAVPKSCVSPRLLLYRERCALGDQLERLYEAVSRERVLVVLLDDLRADPAATYDRIFSFLGLSPDSHNEYPIVNVRSQLRSQKVARAARWLGRAKRRIGIVRSLGIARAISRANTAPPMRQAVTHDVLREMHEVFAPQIDKVERLTGRDLHSWRKVSAVALHGDAGYHGH